jgi:hypothetical protein
MSEEQQPNSGGDSYLVQSVSGGAVSLGPGSTATNYAGTAGPALDETTAALLAAVRALGGELAGLAASDATQEARRELAETEREITETGRATPDRLRRLGELVAPGATVLGLLASAATVAQAVGQLLGLSQS